MGKLSSQYICQQCNYESSKWYGRCPECGSWNTAVETISEYKSGRAGEYKKTAGGAKPIKLAEIKDIQTRRTLTKIPELDRVLGGGIVPGQVILIAGEPGIGKSTLLLQVAEKLTVNQDIKLTEVINADNSDDYVRPNKLTKLTQSTQPTQPPVLYVSGEESVGQIAIRAKRLGISNKNIQLLEETDIDSIANTIHTFKDTVLQGVIVDSIQTMQTEDLSGMAGSVGQVRECAYRLVKLAKSTGIPVFIVGHVTKEGTIAGPSVLMHIVDTVLWFEGDKTLQVRLLRAVKNRFGPTDEVGIFSMGDAGLSSEDHPEKFFLSETNKAVPGSVVSCVMNGTRPLMVEIQSLIVPSKLAIPRRVAQGIDSKKLELLLAVLSRRCGLSIYESDVYVSVMGGINIKNDPSIDLAVCMSLASGYFNKPMSRKTVVFGEVGLLGEIRGVALQEKRIKEAKRLGFGDFVTSERFDFLQKGIKEMFK